MTAKKSREPDTKNAVTSLVLGILSIVIPILGIILGILAIVYANRQKQIRPDPMADAGRVCGIIGIVLGAILIIIYAIVFAVVFSMMSSMANTGMYDAEFGDFPVDRVMEGCSLAAPFYCAEYGADGDTASLTFSTLEDVNDVMISYACNDPANSDPEYKDVNFGTVRHNEKKTVEIECPSKNGYIDVALRSYHLRDDVGYSEPGYLYVSSEN